MNHLPSLAAFRAFATVAREGSFARAAALLHVSTSAVSHQIRALEEHLGTPLLTRARNGAGHSRTAPTEAGTALLVATEEALARLAGACEAIRQRGRGRQRLVVSANGSFASLWLAPRLANFAGLHPSVEWHMLALESDTPDLEAEGVDVAIVRCRPGEIRPPDRLLFEEEVFPVCTPGLAGAVRDGHLLHHALLEEGHRTSPEMSWTNWLTLLGHEAAEARIVRFSGFNQVIGAALGGAGIALGRSPLLDTELAAGRLVRLFAPLSLPGSWAFILRVRPEHRDDPHVVQLRDFLLAAVALPG